MQVTGLYSYPVKSFAGLKHQSAELSNKGLLQDRNWMLIDENGKAITARDFPKLLHLSVLVNETHLEIYLNGNLVLIISEKPDLIEAESITIFSSTASGLLYNDEVNFWFSNYLDVNTRLARVNDNEPRGILEKHGGSLGDTVGFADQNPILIISEASLEDLNSRLNQPVTMTHFRPNIVVQGCDAFAEDGWKSIKIGTCELEIVQLCLRCIFTTIDPITAIKDANKEPIRTLSEYRSLSTGIAFGVHAIPRKTGILNMGDKISLSN
jgi:uncharacterized protein YcbX